MIVFTAQMGEFQICVVPATGGTATLLVPGAVVDHRQPTVLRILASQATARYRVLARRAVVKNADISRGDILPNHRRNGLRVVLGVKPACDDSIHFIYPFAPRYYLRRAKNCI